jgi:hypothetical protein
LAKLSIASLPYGTAEAAPPAVRPGPSPLWWPAMAIIVLVALFDPLEARTGAGALIIAVPTALLLGLSLVLRHDRPLTFRAFDLVLFGLLFYLTANFVALALFEAGSTAALLRFLRLITQVLLLYALFNLFLGSAALFARALSLLWLVLLLTCGWALLQVAGQQTGAAELFFEYQRTRTFRDVWPATAQFAESAMLGQFLVAALFIFYHDLQQIRRRWLGLGLILLTTALTQSVGALAGLLCWAVFVVVYNLATVLSPQRLFGKLLVLGLVGVTLTAFVMLSRLSLVELVELDLDGSGRQRIEGELLALGYLVEQGQILFGLGEARAETVRSAVGFSDAVSGNAMVELALRYGIVGVALLIPLFCAMVGWLWGLYLFAIFALLGQIDGGVAKPYLWLYMALIGMSLRAVPTVAGRRRRPGAAAAGAPGARLRA